jgi:hypothetical protein
MPVMRCTKKEALQQICVAAWDAYAAAVRESGLSVDPSGTVRALLISELVLSATDQRMEMLPGTARYSAAIHLRGEHLKASLALSRHLSKHNC